MFPVNFQSWLRYFAVVSVSATLLGSTAVFAEKKPGEAKASHADDPRGPAEFTVCSQNLNNLGTFEQSKGRLKNLSPDDYDQKLGALAKRMAKAKCDCIAVQELLAKDGEEGKATLGRLAARIGRATGRIFDGYVGETNDNLSREGFLVARDRAEVQNIVSYHRVELPKILPREKPRFFIRGPLELQMQVRGLEESPSRLISIVNFHFKSKAGKGRDPAELEYETYRMQMAEGLRRVIESRHAQSFASSETIFMALGDRNSHSDTASAEILEGRLALNQFQGEGVCRLSKRGVAICKKDVHLPQRLFSVLTLDPETKLVHGSFLYQNTYSWLDDILMPSESLRYAWERFDSEGNFASGILDDPKEASDHSLVWVRLNW